MLALRPPVIIFPDGLDADPNCRAGKNPPAIVVFQCASRTTCTPVGAAAASPLHQVLMQCMCAHAGAQTSQPPSRTSTVSSEGYYAGQGSSLSHTPSADSSQLTQHQHLPPSQQAQGASSDYPGAQSSQYQSTAQPMYPSLGAQSGQYNSSQGPPGQYSSSQYAQGQQQQHMPYAQPPSGQYGSNEGPSQQYSSSHGPSGQYGGPSQQQQAGSQYPSLQQYQSSSAQPYDAGWNPSRQNTNSFSGSSNQYSGSQGPSGQHGDPYQSQYPPQQQQGSTQVRFGPPFLHILCDVPAAANELTSPANSQHDVDSMSKCQT